LNDVKVGNCYKTIIDRIEGEYYIGRTEFDSPDVDTEVLIAIKDGELSIGSFYNVRITDASEFDIIGVVE
jgi:ribosomal protein S12 methylthiotransferase